MKITVTKYSFVESFRQCGRGSQFTWAALCGLFEYFEGLEKDAEIEIELDPIGICCEWAEYGTALEAANENGFEGCETDSEEDALDYLYENTQVVKFEGGVVIEQF